MPSRKHYYIGLCMFGIAFGYLEASVVVYLRAIYYPEGFAFPMVLPSSNFIIAVEVGREAATLFMLWGIAIAAGWNAWTRYAAFSLLFGIWDIIYYVVLKLVLNWPDSIMDFDVLFLIPIPWIGPCLAPILISVGLIASAIIIERYDAWGKTLRPTAIEWTIAALGGFIVLFTFMRDIDAGVNQTVPQPYWWWLFAIGYLLSAGAFARSLRRANK
jgi:hypothetical protein